MSNRIGNPQRDRLYPYVVKIHGAYCIACFIEEQVKRGPPGIKLELDHANGDVTDWSPENIYPVCKKHNLQFRGMKPATHKRLLEAYGIRNERARERENLSTRKTLIKEEADYKSGPAEMKANSSYEPKWLNFMHEQIGADGSITKDDAISGGAHASGCAVQTSRNYLIKYTSPWSCFQETIDSTGNKVIIYRESRLE